MYRDFQGDQRYSMNLPHEGSHARKDKTDLEQCTAEICRILSGMGEVNKEQQFLSHLKQTEEVIALHNI